MRRVSTVTISLLVVCGALSASGAEDILIADFEGNGCGDWEVEGETYVFAKGGSAKATSLEVYELRSAWQRD